MQEIAEKSRHLPDSKIRRLIDWIRTNLCQELPPFGKQPKGTSSKWNNRRVLIFTENREGTKRYLKTILEQAIEGTDRCDERIEVIDRSIASETSSRRSRSSSTACSFPAARRRPRRVARRAVGEVFCGESQTQPPEHHREGGERRGALTFPASRPPTGGRRTAARGLTQWWYRLCAAGCSGEA
jgi:hypothetical protein